MHRRKLLGLAVFAFALLFVISLYEAYRDGKSVDAMEVVLQLADNTLWVILMYAVIHTINEMRYIRDERASLQRELERSRLDGEKWRREAQSYIEGLGAAIRRQLANWELTEGEADVALLMLKGLSHREIAQARKTGEGTVRQQAQSIYAKSKLRNRAELAAYFLDDISAPISEPSAPPAIPLRPAARNNGLRRNQS